jgi:hypothetical protein
MKEIFHRRDAKTQREMKRSLLTQTKNIAFLSRISKKISASLRLCGLIF